MTSDPKLPDARILIVDDEPQVRDLLCAILQDSYHCTTAQSGESAIARIRDEHFDLIVSDINLGGMSGLELIAQVLGIKPDSVVMVISGSSSIDTAIQAIRKGAFDYLKKPFEVDQVEIAVERAIGHANLIASQRKHENHLEQLVEERAAKLNYLAFHDALTGLGNRAALEQELLHSLTNGASGQSGVAMMLVSLDNFKALRDGFGHAFGDSLLREVAERLTGLTATTSVARFEGDEFAILSRDTDPEVILDCVRQVVGNFVAPFKVGEYEVFVSYSIGLAFSMDAGNNAQVLLRNAGAALSHARQLGGGNYQFYTSDINLRAVRRLELENELRRALERDEITLHYQPKLDTMTGRITGAEALVRWNHPKLGPVPPLDFIPIAESTGFIIPLGDWIIETACRQTRIWHDKGFKIEMAVNLSPRQFQGADLERRITDILEECRLEASYLNLEVTESSVMNNADAAVQTLRNLREAGVKISIDDFGTGYSSLGYLQKLPIDILKIDRSFVQEVSARSDDATLIVSIITLADNLGLRVVAEGVETDEQSKFLRLMKCDEWQGYLHSKPVGIVEFEALLIADRQNG